jgi:cephalosporin-C deacetylase-like acetyl esterase
MDIAPGRVVADRYRIVDRIGEGGMGVVYRAVDEQLHRTIALKFLPGRRDPDQLGRFRNEARALSALNHPHIVTMHEVGEDDGTPFFVMELVDGVTLRTRLQAGALPIEDAVEICSQVARGLTAAHEKGLIHRDIKPENVMIRRDGYVKILDFGIAALRTSQPDVSMALTEGSLETVATGLIGTPAYMAPEQLEGGAVDARTDIFALGLLLCESLTGRNPFRRSNAFDTAASIRETPAAAERLLADQPPLVRSIVLKALARDPASRYGKVAEFLNDLRQLATASSRTAIAGEHTGARRRRALIAIAAAVLAVILSAAGFWYRQSSRRAWVLEQAMPEASRLIDANRTTDALRLIQEAERYLPSDAGLISLATKATRTATIHSTPPGATVEVQDYASPDSSWLRLGVTPLERVRVPAGFLRWHVARSGVGESTTAPLSAETMTFDLAAAARAPAGMVPVDGGTWLDILAFLGLVGPFELPAYDIDRFEVTNRRYQAFVDAGGYSKREYWTEPFVDGARTIEWSDAMARFRDATERQGPATWTGGRFPEGADDMPVTGVSWYEALAYTRFADRSLPVMAQIFKAEPAAADQYVLPISNLSGTLAKAGQFRGLGPYGTFDLIGNAREWTWNGDGARLKYALGRLPESYGPEALSPFDRSPLNGFRCVKNASPVPEPARAPLPLLHRDFSRVRPATDDVFRIYRNMFAYDRTPLDASVDGATVSTEDWTEEKVTFRTAYNSERMAAYLFLPKRARPPFQTIVFFPSARVNFLSSSADLGDMSFIDYVIQSGRAVLYPVYEGLYERRGSTPIIPGSTLERQRVINWSKDLGRSIDYLDTRAEIDHDRIGYLGVSQGAAYGVILAALDDRLKTNVFLDGGYFQFEHPIAGIDQVDFAARLRSPVLMVNGRYDATFPYESAQRPMFEAIATPPAAKKHVVFDTPHDVRQRRQDLVREVLSWLDTHLGRVQ